MPFWTLARKFGLQVNVLKSNIFMVGIDDEASEDIQQLMGFSIGSLLIFYLCVPLASIYLKVVNFSPLLDKVSKTLSSWVTLKLSYAGKEK